MPRPFDAALWRRKLASFLGQSLFVQLWFIPVWLGLGLARIWVRMRPFRKIAPRLGRAMGAAPWVPLASAAQTARALQISRVVRMAARYTPWTSDCYPQAIMARGLLGLYDLPYMLYFGLRRARSVAGTGAADQSPDTHAASAGAPLEAHAWVHCGRMAVTGGVGFDRFTVVSQFVTPRLDGAIAPATDTLPPALIGALAQGRIDTRALDLPRAATLTRHGLAVAVVEALERSSPKTGDTSDTGHAAKSPISSPTLAPAVARLRQIRRRTVMRMMTVLATLHRVNRAMADADGGPIRFLVIKGPALAVQTTGHWQGRPSTDLDLLIHPQDVTRAHAALVAAGFARRDGVADAPGRLSRWANCEQPYEGGAVPVDLHWRMDMSPAQGNLAFDALWSRAQPVQIDSLHLRTPAPVDAWLFTALHGAKSGWARWSMLLDAHRQWQALDAPARELSRRRAQAAGCAPALALAEALVMHSLAALSAPDDGSADGAENPPPAVATAGGWDLKARTLLQATAAGHPPPMTARAALGRLRDAQRFAPGPFAGLGLLMRALARVLLRPAAYRNHFGKMQPTQPR